MPKRPLGMLKKLTAPQQDSLERVSAALLMAVADLTVFDNNDDFTGDIEELLASHELLEVLLYGN